ncbi:P7 [Arracacha virus 1]|uniref:P7 n=1 Tax=Arracacha virus 1 TaxID=2201042 RepID=A0A2U8JH91_9CLOS|nr:P7 [Arracacha virus 1]AWK68094.1 P7 [Arracacha virus 1]
MDCSLKSYLLLLFGFVVSIFCFLLVYIAKFVIACFSTIASVDREESLDRLRNNTSFRLDRGAQTVTV